VCAKRKNQLYIANNIKKVTEKKRLYRASSHGRKVRNNHRKNYPKNQIKAQKAIQRKPHLRPELCELCGIDCKPDGHHWDYSKENWLNVVWVCKKCHSGIHYDTIQDRIKTLSVTLPLHSNTTSVTKQNSRY